MLVLALTVTVAACATEPPGQDQPVPGAHSSGGGGEEPEAFAVHHDVEYYGACGNEVLRLGRETYYPLLEDEELDVIRYGSGTGVHVSTVERPGPGDDIGTLTVYSDGYARFVSDSGTYDIWLTEQEREYTWEC